MLLYLAYTYKGNKTIVALPIMHCMDRLGFV